MSQIHPDAQTVELSSNKANLTEKKCCIVCCTIDEGVVTTEIRNLGDPSPLPKKNKKFKVKKPVTFKEQMQINKLE